MRLTCPRCNAQYEIPDSVIPATGREVECSSCSHVWHQPGGTLPEIPKESVAKPVIDADYDPAARPALNQPLHDSILSILREETARELAVRKEGPRKAAPAVDHIPATPLPDAPEPAPQPQDFDWPVATVILPGEPLPPEPEIPSEPETTIDIPADIPEPQPQPAPEPAPPHLPDAAELAATLTRTNPAPLRPALAEQPVPVETVTTPEPPETARNLPALFIPKPRRSSYGMGFGLAVMLALALVALYALAPRIAPDAAWVQGLDQGRLWLADQIAALRSMILG